MLEDFSYIDIINEVYEDIPLQEQQEKRERDRSERDKRYYQEERERDIPEQNILDFIIDLVNFVFF